MADGIAKGKSLKPIDKTYAQGPTVRSEKSIDGGVVSGKSYHKMDKEAHALFIAF